MGYANAIKAATARLCKKTFQRMLPPGAALDVVHPDKTVIHLRMSVHDMTTGATLKVVAFYFVSVALGSKGRTKRGREG